MFRMPLYLRATGGIGFHGLKAGVPGGQKGYELKSRNELPTSNSPDPSSSFRRRIYDTVGWGMAAVLTGKLNALRFACAVLTRRSNLYSI